MGLSITKLILGKKLGITGFAQAQLILSNGGASRAPVSSQDALCRRGLYIRCSLFVGASSKDF